MIRRIAGLVRTNPAVGRAALALLPNMPVTIRIEGIGPFSIRLRRDRRFWVRHPLEHERFFLGAMARLVRPGDVVYDIGANLGMYTRFFVQVFGASRVVAFEPMSANRRDLMRNLALGNVQGKASVFPVALAEKEGDELLQVDEIASGAAALDRVTHGQASMTHRVYHVAPKTERVKVETLDGLSRREALPPPSVMKIDVEEAESLVLRGGCVTIEKHKPRLAIELHGPETARQVLPMLADMGYVMYSHGDRGGQHWWGRVDGHSAREATGHYEFHFVFAAEHDDVFHPPFADWHAARR